MRHDVLLFAAAAAMLAACAPMNPQADASTNANVAARASLAPTGTLRAGMNLQRGGHFRLRRGDAHDSGARLRQVRERRAARVEGAAEIDVDDGAEPIRAQHRRGRGHGKWD